MAKKTFTVMIAGIVKHGMEDYVEDYLISMMHYSKSHEGCLNYTIHRSLNNPHEYMMYSVWESEEAFQKHNQQHEMQEFRQKLSNEMFEQLSPKTYWLSLDN